MTAQMLKQILQDNRGATAVEYGLICAMIVLAMLVALQGVASETDAMWTNVQNNYDTASN